MPKYRKKPVVIDAVQIPAAVGGAYAELPSWLLAAASDGTLIVNYDGSLTIKTLEGDMLGSAGDWIIRGVKGEIYPCKPDIFAATYDPVE